MPVSLRRVGKFVTFVTLAVVVLAGAARIGVGRYLSSDRGKAMVSDRLSSSLGMPVEVSEVDIGNDASSFRFRVMDPADPKAEVLNVHSASADVTATDLVTGRVTPSALNLKGAALTLRVGPGGQVVTPLPAMPGTSGTVPLVLIDNARVSVRQDGRAEFALSGVNLKLEPATPTTVAITGSVNDPKWGAWTVRGELLRENRSGWVELTCTDAPLDPELLATVPFAPAGLFDDVPTGDRAAVTLRLTIGPDRDVQPAVEIRRTRRVFGVPATTAFRLAPGSDRYYFEPIR